MIRRRINRVLRVPVAAAIERLPALEQLVSSMTDARRLHIALTRLKRRGLQIEVVYDIGAHRGQWTTTVRSTLPEARFYLFEANEAHTGALQETGERYFTAVLSSEEKLVEFYATGSPGDSYFRETTQLYAGVQPRKLRTTTLDDLVQDQDLPAPDFIKADVQGAELDVLRGGQHTLRKAKLVLLECPIVEYNEGAPTIDEYFRFMHEVGFTPLDFVARIWRDGRMVQVDVLFADADAGPRFVP